MLMPVYSEHQIASLLGELPAPPDHWIEAARHIPRVKRQLEEVLPHLGDQASGRAVETAEMERAIDAAGLEPAPELVNALRRHFESEES